MTDPQIANPPSIKAFGSTRTAMAFWTMAAYTVVALIFAMGDYHFVSMRGITTSFGIVLISWLIVQYSWALLTPLIWVMVRRFPLEHRWRRELPAHLFFSIVLSGFQLILSVGILRIAHLGTPDAGPSFAEQLRYTIDTTAGPNWLVYWFVVAYFRSLIFYRKYQERAIRSSMLEADLTKAKLAALTMQLEPHFLFNTLNGISSLMRQDVERADSMLLSLSGLLRTSLERSDAQEVTLSEELSFISKYLDIHRVRLGHLLRVEMHIAPDNLDALVPAMILQPIVENAVIHGAMRRTRPTTIEIRSERQAGNLTLSVTNPVGLARDGVPNGLGIGIQNTRARLRLFYGEEQELTVTYPSAEIVCATMLLPFRIALNYAQASVVVYES